jgi:LmbE family N-acetylglucosaminyl deacetylase
MKLKQIIVGVFLVMQGGVQFSFGQTTIPSSIIVDQLKTVANTTSVLYLAAHPDDENTRLITYLTKHEHADVSYLSLTRGDGGQNLIGTEISEQLGLVRTHELLAARRIDGAKQYFTRAIDFGYSKTPDETFEFWEKEEILSDVVWVIRNVRPDVIVTRFSPEINPDRGTHGHHTASAILAVEAFEAAGDPSRFPEQLEYVKVWKPKSIFWNTSYWFYGSVERMDEEVAKDPGNYVKVDVNKYLPLLGKSGSDISSSSRSQHKSQGFGNSPVLANQWEYLQLLKGTIEENQFSSGFKETGLSSKLDKLIQKAIKSFDILHPEKSLSLLFEIRNQLGQIDDALIKKAKLELIHKIILEASGIKATAFSKNQLVHVGESINSKLEISGATSFKITSIESKWSTSGVLQKPNYSGAYFTLPLTWVVPDNGISQPYWLAENKKKGLYTVNDQNQIGLASNNYPFELSVSLEIQGNMVVMKLPLMHGSTDPVKGQIIQPLVVTPNVMLNIERDVLVFATASSKTLNVEVISGKPNEKGYVELLVPEGWKCEPAFIKATFEKAGDRQQFSFALTPPSEENTGVIRAIFKDESLVYSMGLYQLKYDHLPEVALFPSAESKVVRLNLKKEGQNIAYVKGAGDKVMEGISEMGYVVKEVSVEMLLLTDLHQYDAVVFGIRALNTLNNVSSVNTVLSEYVNQGGNLVMQYNTAHRLKTAPLGPYEIKLSRDRVTEEDAIVQFLDTAHQVLNAPNKITESDFDNWVQERGLYFPNEWEEAMHPILGMHDNGETEKQGSLLVGQYGKGFVVYTGLSFFRELPAGVPGAYRLLANILSL